MGEAAFLNPHPQIFRKCSSNSFLVWCKWTFQGETREQTEFPSGFPPGHTEMMHEGQDLKRVGTTRDQRVGRLTCVQENLGV